MLVLGIETSCDETSAAVVENGTKILSNIISSQIDIHKKFGGVVPEVASRNHLMAISNVVDEALKVAGISKTQIDLIAVTYGAGLIGALMVGVTFAKTLAKALGVPLVAVNHIHGHIAANYLIDASLRPPFTALVVSGGHTAVLDVVSHVEHKKIISTADDAMGEVFDKVARVWGLPYPGGPNVEKLAAGEAAENIFNYRLPASDSPFFSYSGLKTAVINYIHNIKMKRELTSEEKQKIAASFQTLACRQVAERAVTIAKNSANKTLVVCGGVSANKFLQQMLQEKCGGAGVKLIVPPLSLCTDNAAMIAAQGYFLFKNGCGVSGDDLAASSMVDL